MGWEDKTDDTGRSCACSGRASREVGRKEVGVEGARFESAWTRGTLCLYLSSLGQHVVIGPADRRTIPR